MAVKPGALWRVGRVLGKMPIGGVRLLAPAEEKSYKNPRISRAERA
jgi:hypothetical protein